MQGSVTAQFLWNGYHQNLAGVVTGYANQVLGAMAAVAQGAIMLYIIIFGYKMLVGGMVWQEGMSRIVRAIVVSALLGAANYQAFVATPITTTIPNFINNLIAAPQGLQGAQGYDALLNQINAFVEQALAQMVGFLYIGDRVVIWLIGQLAEIIVMGCFFIFSLATAAADILVPVGAVLIPFYLFDATRHFTERWVGKIIALFIVSLLSIVLSQVVVFEDAQYVRQFTQAIGTAPANPGFVQPPAIGGDGGVFGGVAGGEGGPTINTNGAISTLGSAALVFFYGLFLMTLVTGIGLYIGGASGFTAAPVFALPTRVLGRMLRA